MQERERRRVLDLGRVPDRAEAGQLALFAQRQRGRSPIAMQLRRRTRRRAPRERAGRLALLPAHTAAADLLERQPRVEGHRVEQLLRGHRAAEHVEVEPEAQRQLGDHLPAGAHLARPRDRRAQALQAPVGVHDRALLLGVGLGREDDVGVLGDRLGQERGVGDDRARGAASARRHSSRVGQVAQRVGLQQVEASARPRERLGDRVRVAPAGSTARRGRGRRSAARRPRAGRARWRARDFEQPGAVDARRARARRRSAAARARRRAVGPAARRSPHSTTTSRGRSRAARRAAAPRARRRSPPALRCELLDLAPVGALAQARRERRVDDRPGASARAACALGLERALRGHATASFSRGGARPCAGAGRGSARR